LPTKGLSAAVFALVLLVVPCATPAASAPAAAPEIAASPAPVPEHVDWAPSQQIVFTGVGGGVYAISRAGGRPRQLTSGEGDSLLSITRGGRLVYGKGSRLFTIPEAGGKPRNLGSGFSGVWSPDGKRIAYAAKGGYLVEDAEGRHKRLVAKSGYTEFTGAPTWSPDGRKLAYVACRAPFLSQPCEHQYGFDVYVIGLDGSDKHRVTPKAGFPQCPAWSSIGKLAFLADSNLVAVVKKAGVLRTFRPGDCPVWAPSGRRFAVATATGASLMNFDGSHRRQITVSRRSDSTSRGVAWSPDGKWLAIVDGSNHPHLWIVRTNGTGLRRLA
jgi:WD40 repeat protein